MPLTSTQYSAGETKCEVFPIVAREPGNGISVQLGDCLTMTSDRFQDAVLQDKHLHIQVVNEAGELLAETTTDVFVYAGDYTVPVQVDMGSGWVLVDDGEYEINDGTASIYWPLVKNETRDWTITVKNVADITSYTVEFIWNTDVAGAIGANNANDTYAQVQVPVEENKLGDQMPLDPVYNNLYFEGWNTRADGKGRTIDENSAINGDLKVYGQWRIAPLTSEYHVMELDTSVDAYIREALALDADDTYSITEMCVVDTRVFTDSDDHWAEHDGQAYWYILNAGTGLVWEDSGLVWPELLDRVEIFVEVNGSPEKVEMPREDLELRQLQGSDPLGTPKHIVEIHLSEDSIPQPPVEEKTGTLMVGKHVAGLSSYVGVPADYSVTITVTAAGETKPIRTLDSSNADPGVNGRVLQWELKEVTVGTYTVTETYSPDIVDKDGNIYKAKAEITNNGSITVTEDAVVWANVTNTYEKSDEQTNPPVTPASLTLTKSVDKTYANPGDEVTYTIYVRNSGTTAAQNVTVTDTLDSYLTFVSGSEGVSAQGQEISWAGDVAGESVVSFQVTARISQDTPINTFITNRAYVDDTASNEVWTKVEEETEIPDGKVELRFQYVTGIHNASAVPNGVTAPETVELDEGSVFGTYGHGTGDYNRHYTFHGWFADADCTEPMEEDTVLTQDTVVYGYWTYSSDGSGGTGGGDGDGGSTDVPDENVPTTDLPDVDVPTTDLPDVDVPITEVPDEGTDLGDGDVPLAEVPKTGDSSALWVLAAAVSGIGLVWLTVSKKRETER